MSMDDLSVQLALAFTSIKEETTDETDPPDGPTDSPNLAKEVEAPGDEENLPVAKAKKRVLTRRVSWLNFTVYHIKRHEFNSQHYQHIWTLISGNFVDPPPHLPARKSSVWLSKPGSVAWSRRNGTGRTWQSQSGSSRSGSEALRQKTGWLKPFRMSTGQRRGQQPIQGLFLHHTSFMSLCSMSNVL